MDSARMPGTKALPSTCQSDVSNVALFSQDWRKRCERLRSEGVGFFAIGTADATGAGRFINLASTKLSTRIAILGYLRRQKKRRLCTNAQGASHEPRRPCRQRVRPEPRQRHCKAERRAAMQPFKINNLGHFCLTVVGCLCAVFYSCGRTRLDRFYWRPPGRPPLLRHRKPPSIHCIAPVLRQVHPALGLVDALLSVSHALQHVQWGDAPGRVLLVEALDLLHGI